VTLDYTPSRLRSSAAVVFSAYKDAAPFADALTNPVDQDECDLIVTRIKNASRYLYDLAKKMGKAQNTPRYKKLTANLEPGARLVFDALVAVETYSSVFTDPTIASRLRQACESVLALSNQYDNPPTN
jgi:hypothetical protein